MKMITASQHRTYEFIKGYIAEHNIAPTEAEIATGIGIKSRGVVHRYIHALADAGLLEVIPKRKRNIRLIEQASANQTEIPLAGTIAAGKPIEAINNDEVLDVSGLFIGDKRYALRVQGDSMVEEGIFDGDIVICQHANTAKNGDIIVALVDGDQATLKRFTNNNDGTVTLFPANSQMKPMVYAADRVQIQGLYVGLIRV